MIKAGKLIHRIELLTPVETKSTIGEASISYQSIGKVWARVFEKLNKESVDLSNIPGTQSTKTYEITIRTHSTIDTSCRIVYGTKTLGIASIANLEDRTGHLIIAVEVV